MSKLVLITLALAVGSLGEAKTTECLTPVAKSAEANLKAYYSTKTGKPVLTGTYAVLLHSMVNGPNYEVDSPHYESVRYDTYNLSLIVDVNRGRPGGYRIDPLIQVRVKADTCEIFKIIALNILSDTKEGLNQSPKNGTTYVMSGESQRIYAEETRSSIVQRMMSFQPPYHPQD